MSKIVLFNGPPGSGKDQSVQYVLDNFTPSFVEKHQFKDKLFELTAMMFNVSLEDLTGRMYTREAKELAHIGLGGLSPREALIFVSERIIKPNFHEGYFGEALGVKVAASDAELIAVSDSGFLEEALELLDHVDPQDILVVRLFRDGCDFSNDSRDYLDEDELFEFGIRCIDLENNGTLEELRENVLQIVESFLSEEFEC